MKQRFKHSLLTQKKCINKIRAIFNAATAAEYKEGLHWYNDANAYSKELAARFDVPVSQVVGIIAAFSPQAGWQENKRYTLSFLLNPLVNPRSQIQFDKAKAILKMTNEASIYNALSVNDAAWKTKAFFLNILNPSVLTDVTIDRHAIAICLQNVNNVHSLSEDYGKLTKKQYTFFESCYIKLAVDLGLLPHQLQAITWTVYRRLRELKVHDKAMDWKPFDSVSF